MKSASKKLLVSVVVLVVAVTLAITSTFAWFTMNAEPTVNSFNLEVTTSDGLQISASNEAGSFDSTVLTSELYAANSTTLGTTGRNGSLKLTNVTTENKTSFNKINGISGYDIDYSNATNNTDYLTFNLYFKSNQQMAIKLKNGSNTYVNSSENTSIANKQAWRDISLNEYGTHAAIEEGDDLDAQAKDAIRIAFSGNSNTYVWNPNSTAGFDARNLALDLYNHEYGSDVGGIDIPADAGTDALAVPSSDIFNETLLRLTADTAGYIGTMKVTVWLEGWDGDCLSSILADVIAIALQFEGTVTTLESELAYANANISTAVSASDAATVFSSMQYVSEAVMDTYTGAIAAARAVKDNGSSTQAEKEAAKATLFAETNTFNAEKAYGTKVTLASKISQAKINLASTAVSTDGSDVLPANKWVDATEAGALSDAITAAESKLNGTLAEKTSAVETLETAISTFNTAKEDGTKTV